MKSNNPQVRKSIRINYIFFIAAIIVGVIGIILFFEGMLDKVKSSHEAFYALDHYNKYSDKDIELHRLCMSSGTVLTFSLIGCIGAIISGIFGILHTKNHEKLWKINFAVAGVIFSFSLGFFVQFVNPLTYFNPVPTLQYHSWNVPAAIFSWFAFIISPVLIFLGDKYYKYIIGPILFIFYIGTIIFAFIYFQKTLEFHHAMIPVQPKILNMSIYLLLQFILSFIFIGKILTNDKAYNAECVLRSNMSASDYNSQTQKEKNKLLNKVGIKTK